ncbi:MAG: hypothetical protein GZ094_03215 [Mariniphaga sp.]|nr:hypothetical protein [Mariniphaga sp.]
MEEETVLFISRIINDFNGWSGETEFEFANGQKWQQIGRKYCSINVNIPVATMVCKNGGYWMIVNLMEVAVKKIS